MLQKTCFACCVDVHSVQESLVWNVESAPHGIIAESANYGTMTQTKTYIIAVIVEYAGRGVVLEKISSIARYG
jgi:hypothetical protein